MILEIREYTPVFQKETDVLRRQNEIREVHSWLKEGYEAIIQIEDDDFYDWYVSAFRRYSKNFDFFSKEKRIYKFRALAENKLSVYFAGYEKDLLAEIKEMTPIVLQDQSVAKAIEKIKNLKYEKNSNKNQD